MPLAEGEEFASGCGGPHSDSDWDQLCKLFVGRPGGWPGVRLGVTNVVTVAPAPHLLRTGPGYSVRGGRWTGSSNSENGSEPLAGALFISFSFSVEVKVKSAYGQGGLPWTGVKARIHTHFQM